MINWVPPVVIFMLGAILVPFTRGKVRQAYLLAVPVIALLNLLNMQEGTAYSFNYIGYELIFGRVDALSMVFGYAFVIMAFAGALYSLHLKETGEHIAALLYAGSSLGVVFAGDYLSLFIFWEAMALASTYLIWARRTEPSRRAGLRYIIVHLAGGLSLLAGIMVHVAQTGSLEFSHIGLTGLASYFILIGFAVNAAIPPLSAWLPDAYPEATVTGAVFLSAFTSKTGVYVLARAFSGTELLIWAGAVMAIYGIIYAVLENDIRRVLSYGIINQVGFMVLGIGIGTELAINGAVAHAFASIIYKSLLMMSAGAVLYVTGKSRATELGGLYKSMPLTMVLFLIGAASISAFPLTSGFVSKSMVVAAAGYEHMLIAWQVLVLASAGAFLYAGIKLPRAIFFAQDAGLKAKEPPLNMLLGMGLMAVLTIAIGVAPGTLYAVLPYPVDYEPYTATHIVEQLQVLLFAGFAFSLLVSYLKKSEQITLDTDWFYRKGAGAFLWFINNPMAALASRIDNFVFDRVPLALAWASKNPIAVLHIVSDTIRMRLSDASRRSEIEARIQREKDIYPGDIVKHWPIGTTVLWVTLFLLAYLLAYYL